MTDFGERTMGKLELNERQYEKNTINSVAFFTALNNFYNSIFTDKEITPSRIDLGIEMVIQYVDDPTIRKSILEFKDSEFNRLSEAIKGEKGDKAKYDAPAKSKAAIRCVGKIMEYMARHFGTTGNRNVTGFGTLSSDNIVLFDPEFPIMEIEGIQYEYHNDDEDAGITEETGEVPTT